MEKVLVIGANGKVGKILIQKLEDSSKFVPVAGIRKEEQESFFQGIGVDSVILNLEHSVDQLSSILKDVDAVVFSAGSGGKTGDDKTLAVDLDGAVKVMEAAESVGVKRFVMVSAIHADDRSKWKASGINGYYIAKHYADKVLQNSELDYTILRPGLLLDEKGSGSITTDNPEEQKGVPREDVAQLVVEVLENNRSIGKVITFNQGNTPIRDVV